MDMKKPGVRRKAHFGAGFAAAGETDVAGGEAGRSGAAKFARRYDIRTQAKSRQCRQNSGIGIGLDREGDQWIEKGLKRFLKHADMTFQSGSRIDVNGRADRLRNRSEEHTSELQSLMRISYAVFCLKKKQTQNTQQDTQTHVI